MDSATDIVLNVHMQPTGRLALVQPTRRLHFTDRPGTAFPILVQLEHDGAVDIPDGSRKWLIRIPNWDVNWQAVYRDRTPVFLLKGTVVSMRFHYDNSDGTAQSKSLC